MGFPGLLLQAITVWRSQDCRRQKALVPRAPWLIGVLDNFPSSLSCSSEPLKKQGMEDHRTFWQVNGTYWEQALPFSLIRQPSLSGIQ